MRAAGLLFGLMLATPSMVEALPFGPTLYAGVQTGAGRRNAEVSPAQTDGHRSADGVDYGAFAGIELPAAPLLFYGAEIEVGGSTTRPDVTTSQTVVLPPSVVVGVVQRQQIRSRLDYAATARFGVTPVPGLGIYALAGYSAERVRIDQLGTVAGFPTASTSERATRDGLIYGGGIRYGLGHGLSARLEYRVRNTPRNYEPRQLLLGIALRL